MAAGARNSKFGGSIKKIAVLRALKLGDLLCAVPAWRALRRAWPQAEIVLVGLPWAAAFVEQFDHLFDDFREFPGYPGLPEQPVDPAQVTAFLQSIQAEQFDLSLQMQGDGSIVNPLVELFKAHQTAGFFRPGDYCPDAERFLPYPDTIHEVRRHLRLMEFLDIPLQGEELEFPTKPADTARLKRLQHKYGLQSHRYIVVHPGAISARPWPPAAFAKVADALAPAGWQIVLTGTASEQTITARVAAKMKHPVIDLAGVTDLGSLAALIRDAALLVANDTGVSHVAAATRTPSVIIVTTSDPARWAPLDRLLHRPVLQPAPADWQSVVAAAVQLLS